MDAKKRRTADWLAAFAVLVVGGLLAFVGATAFARGEQNREVAPVRALLGNQSFQQWERWCEGDEMPGQHYVRASATPRNSCQRPRLRAPDFSLPQADGTQWRLSEHRGKVIVINFWTVTCQPCMEEMPSLIELAQILEERDDDIELVTISVDRDWETVRTAIPEDSPLTVLLDPEREIVNGAFGTRLFPETWVIDREGIVQLRVDGSRNWSSALALDAFSAYL